MKSKELRHAFLSEDDADEDQETLRRNVIDFSSEIPANWRAETKRRKGQNLDEWTQVTITSQFQVICIKYNFED